MFAENYHKSFKAMALIPEAQKAFEEKLLIEKEISERFPKWSEILANPEQCQTMVSLMNTFSKETQSNFYNLLAKVMYQSDFMQESSSFHPELLALNER